VEDSSTWEASVSTTDISGAALSGEPPTQHRGARSLSTRTTASRLVGVLFIVALAADLLATALRPSLSGTDYLTRVSAHANQVTGGALLSLIAAFASAGIAVSMYPVLKKRNATLALGVVVFRTLEAAMYVVATVGLLSLLTLGQQFTSAAAPDHSAFQAIGDSLVSLRQHASLAGVFAFSLGAFLYYYLFFRSRLIPRWLSGWGIAAIILMMVACLLALFSDSPVTGYVLLALPIGVQEMVLAVWLIVKGFRSSPLPSTAASGDSVLGGERK
jgi:hypothetical protein